TGLNPYQTGTVTCLVEILAQFNAQAELDHEFLIFCSPAVRHHFDALGLDNRFKLVMTPSRKLAQLVWQQTVLPYQLWRLKADVHWGPTFVLPMIRVCPMVVTIHDMTFELFAHAHEPIKRIYFPFMIRRAVKRATHVLCISQSTADDLTRLVKTSQGKVVITPLAARQIRGPLEACAAADACALPTQPYLLYVGTLEPRKNLARLLQAWQSLDVTERADYQLVIVGVKGWMIESLLAQAHESAQHRAAVEVVGHVSNSSLDALLKHATAFVYPSLYEGFGLPVIEAMAAGVPVLTSNVGATREIAHDAALLVDPHSVPAIKDGLSSLLQDQALRQRLAAAGLARAAKYDWSRTGTLTLDALTAAKTGG
ncbi:MAG TPA: glycosyltransferase family 1 protein, partial [Orrella sp.]